jgi:hypothetical protein
MLTRRSSTPVELVTNAPKLDSPGIVASAASNAKSSIVVPSVRLSIRSAVVCVLVTVVFWFLSYFQVSQSNPP